jgi:hypothetical protein
MEESVQVHILSHNINKGKICGAVNGGSYSGLGHDLMTIRQRKLHNQWTIRDCIFWEYPNFSCGQTFLYRAIHEWQGHIWFEKFHNFITASSALEKFNIFREEVRR